MMEKLDPKKIYMMTRLSLYEKKERKALTIAGSYFRGDYIEKELLKVVVRYTILFSAVLLLVTAMKISLSLTSFRLNDLKQLFLFSAVLYFLFLFFLSLVMIGRFGKRYDDAREAEDVYREKLDQLYTELTGELPPSLPEEEDEPRTEGIASAGRASRKDWLPEEDSEFWNEEDGEADAAGEETRVAAAKESGKGQWLDESASDEDIWLDSEEEESIVIMDGDRKGRE